MVAPAADPAGETGAAGPGSVDGEKGAAGGDSAAPDGGAAEIGAEYDGGAPTAGDSAAVPDAPTPAPAAGKTGAEPAGPSRRPGVPPASSEATRHVMQANRGRDTSPELAVRAALRAAGLTGYRLHWKGAPGRPDVCFVGRRVAIFVHGCYWHRCPHCALRTPRTHAEFWEAKFARNRERDARAVRELVSAGWTVVVVWECALKKGRLEATMRDVVREVRLAEALGWPREGRYVEAGFARPWELRARRRHRHRP